MAKDLLTEVKTVRAELDKLETDYREKRGALIQRLKTLRDDVDQQFSEIPELSQPSTPAKKNAPLDRKKVEAWIRKALAGGPQEFGALSLEFKKAFGEDRRLVARHYEGIFAVADGKAKLVK